MLVSSGTISFITSDHCGFLCLKVKQTYYEILKLNMDIDYTVLIIKIEGISQKTKNALKNTLIL